jgi:predicted TIM-barrel fold metal-dependent hydrolase
MGNVTPTITDILHAEEANLARFRRALRREDQVVLDDLFTAAYRHRAAAAYAGHLLPFETFLLAMQIEDHREVMHLREEIRTLREQIKQLKQRLHE